MTTPDGAVMPKHTIVGDKVRIRLEDIALYLPLYPMVRPHSVFQIVGERKINGRHVWMVDGDGPREIFSAHVKRAWGNIAERLAGLREAGVKLP